MDFIRDHPIASAIIAVLVFLLGTLPSWLGGVWPLFTNKTIPEWLSDHSEWRQAVRPWLHIGLTVIVLIGFAVTVYLVRQPVRTAAVPEGAKPLARTVTTIRLAFRGDGSTPDALDNDNIWRWYALKNIAVGIEAKTNRRIETVSWIVFLTFDEPIDAASGTATLRFEGSGLPHHEVKDFSQRSAVIVVTGEIPAGVLAFTVRWSR